MRKLFEQKLVRTVVVGGALLLFQNLSIAENVKFKWSANTDAVNGYRIHYGGASGTYNRIFDAGNRTNATVSNLVAGATYFFALTAYNSVGESDFSNELRYSVPTNVSPSGPFFLAINVTTGRQARVTITGATNRNFAIEATTNLTAWSNIATVAVGSSGSAIFTDTNAPSRSKRFYRARAL